MRIVKYITITTLSIGLLLVPTYWITRHTVVGLLGYLVLLVGNIGIITHAIMRKRKTLPKEGISSNTQEGSLDTN